MKKLNDKELLELVEIFNNYLKKYNYKQLDRSQKLVLYDEIVNVLRDHLDVRIVDPNYEDPIFLDSNYEFFE